MLLFQPAEEGLGGARALIRDGAVADVEAIHGLHVLPDLPSGAVRRNAVRSGKALGRTLGSMRDVGLRASTGYILLASAVSEEMAR